jgi:uncharacterized membrane protein YbhN (UPF0104 family)
MHFPLKKDKLKIIVAWAGTVVILVYVVLTTDFADAFEALLNTNQFLFVVTLVASVLLAWVADSLTLHLVLRQSGFNQSFSDLLLIKGASYLLNVINYNLALAMMATLLSRHSKKGLAKSASPFIFVNFLDLFALGLLLLLGIAQGFHASVALLPFAIGAVVVGPCLAYFAERDLMPFFFKKLRDHAVFLSFRQCPPIKFIGLGLARLCFLCVYVFMTYFFLTAFHFDVPLDAVFVYQPILAFIVFIPISVAGLGSTQVAMRYFYKDFAPKGVNPIAAVDAYSTATIVSVNILRIVISLLCLPFASRLLNSNEKD